MITTKDRVIYYFDKHAEIINGTFYDAVFIAKERVDLNGYGYEIMMGFPWLLIKLFKYLLARGHGEGLFIKLARFDGHIFRTVITHIRESRDAEKGRG